MAAVICISNEKGGVGKSQACASLGVGLARQGKKALIIDADSQHSLTVSMGVTEPDKLPVSLATIMSDIIGENDIDLTAGIIRHSDGVDLMPANDSLTGIELTLRLTTALIRYPRAYSISLTFSTRTTSYRSNTKCCAQSKRRAAM